jgi:L-ascorbate metabolism protein UlaG (beta-lactamase superfamily)
MVKKIFYWGILFITLSGPYLLAQSKNYIQYVGNMGMLVSLEKTQILIDGLHLKYEDDYLNPPQSLLDSLIYHISPYHVDILLFTHVHKDHFHYRPALEFLLKNPNTRLIAPQQVLDTLIRFSNGTEIAGQLVPAEKASSFAWEGVKIQPFLLPHTWKSRHFRIANYAYVLEKNGKRIVHLGDASADEEDFKGPLFHQREFETVIVPAWFLGSNTASFTLRHFKARKWVAGHISPLENTPRVPENLLISVEWMTRLGQRVIF